MQLKFETFFINGLIFALLWLSLIKFGSPTSTGLDPSWTLVLAYAFKHNLQAGTDYVITYGPLGYFTNPNVSYYDVSTFNSFVTWWIIVGGLLVILFLIKASQLQNRVEKWLYLFLLMVILATWSGDPLYLVATMTITLLAIHPPVFLVYPFRYFIFLGITLIFLALLPMMKFSFFFLAVICLLGLLIHIWYEYSYQTALKILFFFIFIFNELWVLLGQSPSNIPAFILNSLQVASNYDEAMSGEYSEVILGKFDFKEYYIALGGMILISVMILFSCLAKPWQLAKFISGTIILCGLFLAWKAGFVRHDGHSMIFFSVLIVIPFLAYRPLNMKILPSMVFSGLLFASVFTGALGVFYVGGVHYSYGWRNFIGRWNEQVVDNFNTLNSLATVKAGRESIVAQLRKEHLLPNVQATVKQATVDIFSVETAIALLNGLNYHPRPVFQSYAAYNEKSLNLNAEFYASSKAPEFVLFKMTPIDGRLPSMEDSQVLKILSRDYQPVLLEKGYVLLKRHPRGNGLVVSTKEPLLEKIVKFDENVDVTHLNNKNLTLSLDIRKSLLGRLTKLFFKLPEVSLVIQTTESANLTYRIIPSMVKTKFIFNPLILNEHDWLTWHRDQPVQRITNFRVRLKPQWSLESKMLERLFQSKITVQISEHEMIPSVTEITKISYPGFSIAPYTLSASEYKSENGRDVLMVHAPGEMRFHIEPGNHKLNCEFGILAGAYDTLSNLYPTDGVEFSVSLMIGNGQENLLFKRLLQPFQVTSDRGMQNCEVVFSATAPGDLALRTHPGPANNTASDWSFWRAVRID